MEIIDGMTALYGVIGNPVFHTASPFFQNRFLEEMGIHAVYLPFPIRENQALEKAVRGLAAAGVRGFNVTIPFKERIVPLMDVLDPSADITDAVNTVTVRSGSLHGANTDPEGFCRDLVRCTGRSAAGARVLLLGAGGAARSVVCGLIRSGAADIHVINRHYERAEKLAADMNRVFGKTCVEALHRISHWKELPRGMPDLVIHATPSGMWAEGAEAETETGSWPLKGYWPGLSKSQVAYDLVYRPPTTSFMRAALEAGCPAYNGLGMLVLQGAASFTIWTGRTLPPDLVESTLNALKGNLHVEPFV